MPAWLVALGAASIGISTLCAIWIVADELRHPQSMRIMNVVWPITALYAGPIGLWAYYRLGRAEHAAASGHRHGLSSRGKAAATPSFAAVTRGTTHCGAGCTLGDIIAELLLAYVPALALALGWQSLWREKMFSAWILDFILAFVLGILFQYLSIKPMHPEMSRGTALKRALQADALSLAAWQLGMYLLMALAQLRVFPALIGRELPPTSFAFWWVMQLAMMAGFLTSYPVNRLLIARGIKEAM